MKTITVEVYDFAELDEKAKETARDWYRQNGIDSEDLRCVIDEAEEIGAMLGFTGENPIQWSGFSCQGDGARWIGAWSAKDVSADALKEHAPKDETLHKIADRLDVLTHEYPEISFKLKGTDRHYVHKYTVSFELDTPAGYNSLLCAKIYTEFQDAAQDFMQWIYDQLEKQNTWLHSSEYVDETIIANEYGFTKDGHRRTTL